MNNQKHQLTQEGLAKLQEELNHLSTVATQKNIEDLKERLAKIIIGYTYDNKPVTAKDLKAVGAMTALLKDAINPNIVQTLEGTPAFIHGGPFANIAHGCNSVLATEMAMALGDYTVTEAGFGADLGAEKFLEIKTGCRSFSCYFKSDKNARRRNERRTCKREFDGYRRWNKELNSALFKYN